MNPAATPGSRPTPWWVWAIIIVLAASQPVMLCWTRYAPPEGAVPTGLQIPDSALFLYSMDMFTTRFESLYATCQSTEGTHSVRFYAVPHLWLYGALGLAAAACRVDPYLLYGVANGAGAFLYLWIIYRFLREAAPRHANRAFLLFTLSGGPGGLLYLISGVAGMYAWPDFETYFKRFALYDLMEGPHFNPVLYFPRLYYTLSLAAGFGALTAIIRAVRQRNPRGLILWMIPVLFGSFLDARFAVFTFGVVAVYLALQGGVPRRLRLVFGAYYAVPAGLGCAASYALMRTNPVVIENHLQVGSMAMWFSPFLIVTWLHLLLAARPIRDVVRRLPRVPRLLVYTGTGYLAAYGALYVIYQGYYGNLLTGRDGSVAAAVSDWALLGAGVGLVQVLLRRFRPGVPNAYAWLLLWLVGYLCISLSAWGGGWFLRFGPQRLQVFLWLPLCIFAAMGLARLRHAPAAWAILLTCGITSVLVSLWAFQGPVGRAYARGPFAEVHAEVMSQIDATMLEHLGSGTVLTPAPAGDVIVRQRGNPVVFGIGTFNLTDQSYVAIKQDVNDFFTAGTPENRRRDIVKRWCVEYVFCPDTWPVAAAVRAELRNTDWLNEIASEGEALLLQVAKDEEEARR